MIKLAYINLIRSNSIKIGLFFILTASVISLFVGKQFIKKAEKNIEETVQFQQEHIERYAEYNKDDIGLLLYYIKFSILNPIVPVNGLSIGQRDINPSVKSVTIRALEAQKYDADLNNPYNLLIGNIDFSFVLVFLFPLLIIAFTYNIISEEKESGTWKIVTVQTKKPFVHILKLFSIRLLMIIGVLFLILLLAIPILEIPINASFWAFWFISILYILVWFGICFWVVSMQNNSNFNAVILLSIWILLVIIFPATINNYLQNRYPVPEALETTLKQRKGYHEKWDIDKEITMNKFYAHYPQFNKFSLPEGDFSWLWYYAMQQTGDDAAAIQSKELRKKLEQRNKASITISQFIPTLHLQVQLNEIAKSGLTNQLLFLDETGKFHEKLRLYFYPKIFSNTPVSSENWSSFKIETFTDNSNLNQSQLYYPLTIFIVIFCGLGWLNFKRKLY